MAVTLKQIARKTGFSIPTVNQILTGYRTTFTEETKRRVREAAAELNYRPNITARSLVTQRSFLVGVLFYSENFDFIAPFMLGLQDVIKGNRCSPIFFTHRTAAEELENLENALDRRVDGLIVNAAIDPDGTTNAERLKAVAAKVPMVEVHGRFIPGVPKVSFDHRGTARMMTERLIADGHTKIALLLNDSFVKSTAHSVAGRHWTHTECWQGYTVAMKAAGLPTRVCPYPTARDGWADVSPYDRVSAILPALLDDPKCAPTAVICYSELVADVVARYLQGRPDSPSAKLVIATPNALPVTGPAREGLMSYPFRAEQAGRTAGDMLFTALAGKPTTTVSLKPTFAGHR